MKQLFSESEGDAANSTVGIWRILGPLIEGELEVAYAAADVDAGSEVALWVPSTSAPIHPLFDEAWRNAARAAQERALPLQPLVLETGMWGETPYMVTERPEGISLARIQSLGIRLGTRERLDIASRLTKGLRLVHGCAGAERRVFGGLHPANIRVTPWGEVSMTGLAWTPREVPLLPTSVVASTLACTAPEVLAGEAANARADVYAVALLIQILFATRSPFLSGDTASTRRAVLQGWRGGVAPASLEGILRAALSRAPGSRPADLAPIDAALDVALIEAGGPLSAEAWRQRLAGWSTPEGPPSARDRGFPGLSSEASTLVPEVGPDRPPPLPPPAGGSVRLPAALIASVVVVTVLGALHATPDVPASPPPLVPAPLDRGTPALAEVDGPADAAPESPPPAAAPAPAVPTIASAPPAPAVPVAARPKARVPPRPTAREVQPERLPSPVASTTPPAPLAIAAGTSVSTGEHGALAVEAVTAPEAAPTTWLEDLSVDVRPGRVIIVGRLIGPVPREFTFRDQAAGARDRARFVVRFKGTGSRIGADRVPVASDTVRGITVRADSGGLELVVDHVSPLPASVTYTRQSDRFVVVVPTSS